MPQAGDAVGEKIKIKGGRSRSKPSTMDFSYFSFKQDPNREALLEKIRIMWEKFPSGGPPPPLAMFNFFVKLNWWSRVPAINMAGS